MKEIFINRIKDLARDNFSNYKEQYVPFTEESKAICEHVADSYFDNRNEIEIERDEEYQITRQDYRKAVLDTIECLASE